MDHIFSSNDAKQAPGWGTYLEKMGWKVEKADHVQIFIKPIPIINRSIIKIQHPKGPLPFEKIEKISKKYKSFYTLIEPHPVGYKENEYLKHGYEKSKERFAHTATIKLDLTLSEDILFKSFAENARRNIRKAEKNNLIIKTVSLKNVKNIDTYFDTYYELFKILASMKKFYTVSYDEYKKKMEAFQKTSYLIFAYKKKGGEPIAVVWYAYFEDVLFYVQPGITKCGYELLANYKLVWEGIKLGKKLGLNVFDFETIYDPRFPHEHKKWIGYSEFKKRFHGTIVEYPQTWHKFYNLPFELIYKIMTMFQK